MQHRQHLVAGLAPILAALALAGSLRAQLPAVPFPPENPITEEKAILGKFLFWEEQVSSDNTTACGTCHFPTSGGGDPRTASILNIHPGPDGQFGTADDVRGSRGVVGSNTDGSLRNDGTFFPLPQVTGRKSPSFVGAMYDQFLFWDGRAGEALVDPETLVTVIPLGAALEAQALGPIVSDVEMACRARVTADVVSKLQTARPMRLARSLPPDMAAVLTPTTTYPDLFAAAFGDPQITPVRFAMAIATYERTLRPDQTAWDAFNQGNFAILTPNQLLGKQLFEGIANCSECHPAPQFTDNNFHDIGVRPEVEDLGRGAITSLKSDEGRFKTPSLRNVKLRAPYFHNGGKVDLSEVLLFYNAGGDFPNPNLDPQIFALNLSHPERLAIIDFIENALLDPRVEAGVSPFDKPGLRSQEPPNPLVYGSGSPGSDGIVPYMLAPVPAMIGSEHFPIGVADALGGAEALVAFGVLPASPGMQVLGSPLHIHPLTPVLAWTTMTLWGPTGVPGAGHRSLVMPIPDNPAFDGLTFFGQWFVADPGALNMLAVSPGCQFTFFAP